MNDLSILLYLAEVSGNAKIVAGVSAFLSTVAATMFLVGTFVMGVDRAGYEEGDRRFKEADVYYKTWKKLFRISCVVLLVSVTIATFAPSRQTVYLIAGSEAGEMVVTSEEGQAILDDVRAVIRSYSREE